MLVLGIESTCDETAVALVRNGREIVSHEIASQVKVHQEFGGVFPEVASRCHDAILIPTIEQTLHKGGVTFKHVDLIAVANTPGLIGPLLMGTTCAKALGFALKIPVIGINHVEAHLYAAMMNAEEIPFPALGLVVSGGHTFIVQINSIGNYTLLSSTVDDALGEAFDKVAKMLGLPYPGGPEVERLATRGDPYRFPFKGGVVKAAPHQFSFSGLKTHVLYTLRALPSLTPQDKADIAASFQRAAFNDIITKINSLHKTKAKALIIGGGVSQNRALRSHLLSTLSLPLYFPSPLLCTDNGAMIAGLAFHIYNPLLVSRLEVEPQLSSVNFI